MEAPKFGDANCKMAWQTYVESPKQGETVTHDLWPTPISLAKPFDDEFLQKLREDVKYLLKPGAPGQFNKTDLWSLPDLPDTMIQVKKKMEQMCEATFRHHCEMPIPPFAVSKGYFRGTAPGSPYRIMPHRHSNVLFVSVFYVTVDDINPGNLVLLDPRAGVNWVNQFSAYKKYRVEQGTMIVHPGYLVHFVEPSNEHMGMFYNERLAIVSNIHRNHDEWVKSLEDNDEQLTRMTSIDF
jgi:hypothetical protein